MAYSELGTSCPCWPSSRRPGWRSTSTVHHELWQYHTLRLAELTEIPEAKEVDPRQRIFDAAGKLVLETGEAPAWPVMRPERASRRSPASQDGDGRERSTTFAPNPDRDRHRGGRQQPARACRLLRHAHPAAAHHRSDVRRAGGNQARLLATIDAIPVEFMEFDREGRLMLINSAARLSQGLELPSPTWQDAARAAGEDSQ